MTSSLFERNYEMAMGESIEEARQRQIPLPQQDYNARLAIPLRNPQTGKYTSEIKRVFPNCERAYREAVRVPFSKRILGFLRISS